MSKNRGVSEKRMMAEGKTRRKSGRRKITEAEEKGKWKKEDHRNTRKRKVEEKRSQKQKKKESGRRKITEAEEKGKWKKEDHRSRRKRKVEEGRSQKQKRKNGRRNRRMTGENEVRHAGKTRPSRSTQHLQTMQPLSSVYGSQDDQ
ncbi:hypothetical protein Pmani_033084 [Petrolisthes manimaculis]|uniref:Uncharacterized protein n=1 Tax=Petrolisthes manimaculis TaxID=1843537 RepID=A0AAE1NS05_9EUCA|nr:hypothetical protein Pmani_033084 [Petrolisthes manimaculis]